MVDRTPVLARADRRAGAPAALVDAAAVRLPRPGAGATPARFARLAGWAATDLSLGRLAEGHHDAVAILDELGGAARPGALYGVWAARSGHHVTVAARHGTGWRLAGTKEFCSGAGQLDRALVVADGPDGARLFDVDLTQPGVVVAPGTWPAVGMADSHSSTVRFDDVEVGDGDAVGPPGAYTDRPGFWHGGAGVAACWWGGARALVERLVADLPPDRPDVVLADVGRAVTAVRAAAAAVGSAARAIDADPTDRAGAARYRTLVVRHAVHDAARAVLGHVAAAGGARPLGHDAVQARRAADLYVYLSQHHGGADAAAVGRAAVAQAAAGGDWIGTDAGRGGTPWG